MTAPTARPGWTSLFSLAFGHSANPMLLMDRGRVIRAANPAHERFSGFRPEQLVGQPLDIVIPPDQRDQLERHWETLTRTGALAGDICGLDAYGGRLQIQFAACRAIIGERDVVTGPRSSVHLL